MTKEEKRNLTWKLGELPTAGELAELVEADVISKEEAREIMFGAVDNDKEKIQALEEQVDFLRSLVTDLSKRSTTVIRDWTYDRPVRWYNTKYWDNTSTFLASNGMQVDNTVNSVNSIDKNDKLYSLSVSAIGANAPHGLQDVVSGATGSTKITTTS